MQERRVPKAVANLVGKAQAVRAELLSLCRAWAGNISQWKEPKSGGRDTIAGCSFLVWDCKEINGMNFIIIQSRNHWVGKEVFKPYPRRDSRQAEPVMTFISSSW